MFFKRTVVSVNSTGIFEEIENSPRKCAARSLREDYSRYKIMKIISSNPVTTRTKNQLIQNTTHNLDPNTVELWTDEVLELDRRASEAYERSDYLCMASNRSQD